MPEIRVLPEAVRDRIAAGEVLERPASAVKELVENALDAQATRVEVGLADGGRSLIRVTDDGTGMAEHELRLAVLRHATSKIQTLDDIVHVTTKGFRGEALPSIGAVSRLEIVSRSRAHESGHRIRVDGGKVTGEAPVARAPGTDATVRDLFYNTPARRKFLKSARAEVAVMHEALARLALAHPEVGFRLASGERTLLDLQCSEHVAERIGDLFGAETSDALVPLAYGAGDGLSVSGFVERPPVSRTNSRAIYTFLNRRWIRHGPLVHVVRRAFEGVLPGGRFPVAFVFLAVDPTRVDVNVHPTKEAVRFADERRVLGSVHRAIEGALRGQDAAQSTRVEKADQDTETPPVPPGPGGYRAGRGPEGSPVHADRAAEPAGAYARARDKAAGRPDEAAPRRAFPRSYAYGRTRPQRGTYAPNRDRGKSSEADSPARTPVGLFGPGAVQEGSRFRLLGQAHESLLVVECPEGVLLIDQHALHERLVYESLRAEAGAVTSQKLLLPAVVELDPDEWAAFETIGDELAGLGFDVVPFDGRSLAVRGAPASLPGGHAARVLRDALGELAEGGLRAADLGERLRRSVACKAAVRAGEHLAEEEIVALLERLTQSRVPFTCPHGRPFSVLMGLEELRRRFERS